ncbi:KpsF/GutQ family sugar-phosphate isomerase [Pelagibius litoralis]|uniref:KpsF/GutQ family sugar-phosphate isomerase n=1 Tax=Pelagibius litoralis TaxID=374515 RepID=A0A967C416_9PROT|nr:KpsF/GutQ family sugar-phosphate isomerase [Pelagibius litoralis]NIA67950.1 KpsF/GutQ family sugar-phosphate isomerase [Pelagibius litoralis]
MKAQLNARDTVQTADLEVARRVLKVEAEALETLARSLDHRFVEAIDRLAAVEGRVVVTGMGKSGHIARKITATLASTGTPAQFVHPGEASHGDLGMITAADAVIALSNSGNTLELSDIITYAKRFAIPLIAITAKTESALAEAATVPLIPPAAPEACPMGLAPTTSTTMMLALGDALAVALMERRGFSTSDFQLLHPGGAIGKRLLRVSDLMHDGKALPLCTADTVMSEAILIMTECRFGCIGIVDENRRLLGIITDGDLRRHMDQSLLTCKAGDIMTASPHTIRANALAAEAVALMNTSQPPFLCVFVVDEAGPADQPVGILHMHDCLRAGLA